MTEALPGTRAAPRGRRRLVLWVGLAVAVVLAVLIAVLATSGPTGQLSSHSPLLGKPAPAITGPNLLAGGDAGAGGGASAGAGGAGAGGAAGGGGQPAVAGLQGAPGHWVLVNFAASWCVPCQQEMPQLLEFAARHPAPDAPKIITVAYQEGDAPALAAYFRSRHVTWPLIDDNSAKVAYGVTGIPESYLVDPQGTVVAKIVSGVNADRLDALIAPYAGRS